MVLGVPDEAVLVDLPAPVAAVHLDTHVRLPNEEAVPVAVVVAVAVLPLPCGEGAGGWDAVAFQRHKLQPPRLLRRRQPRRLTHIEAHPADLGEGLLPGPFTLALGPVRHAEADHRHDILQVGAVVEELAVDVVGEDLAHTVAVQARGDPSVEPVVLVEQVVGVALAEGLLLQERQPRDDATHLDDAALRRLLQHDEAAGFPPVDLVAETQAHHDPDGLVAIAELQHMPLPHEALFLAAGEQLHLGGRRRGRGGGGGGQVELLGGGVAAVGDHEQAPGRALGLAGPLAERRDMGGLPAEARRLCRGSRPGEGRDPEPGRLVAAEA